MKQKITGLTLTLAVFSTLTYLSYLAGENISVNIEDVETEELGLHSSKIKDVKLRRLIKTYEVNYPEQVPWKTCQQEM